MEFEQELALISLSFRLLLARTKELGMMRIIGEFVSLSQQNGYHLSDILKGFSDYATERIERESPEIQPTWRTVSTLLQAAAVEAETPGRELP